MKKMLAITTLISLFSLIMITSSAQSIDQPQTQKPISKKIKWLGVSLQNLSDAMHSQLGHLIGNNEGILIKKVQANSPAFKAGLKNYDIVTRFNNQKVISTQQVYQLVQSSKVGQETVLEIIRAGKKQKVLVTIGTRDIANANPQRIPKQWGFPQFDKQFWNSPNFGNFRGNSSGNAMTPPFTNGFNSPFFQPNWRDFSIPSFPNFPNNLQGNDNSWSQSESESVSIQTLSNGKVRAELSTKDIKGNEKNFVFEDSRENVIKQIQEQKDLPDTQKQNLLNSLQGKPSTGFSKYFFNNSFFGKNSIPNFPQQNRPVY